MPPALQLAPTRKYANAASTMAARVRPALQQEARALGHAATPMPSRLLGHVVPHQNAGQRSGIPTLSGANHVNPVQLPDIPMLSGDSHVTQIPQQHQELSTIAGGRGAATQQRVPGARLDPSQNKGPIDRYMPGYSAHDARLKNIQNKLQARDQLSPSRQRLLSDIQGDRQDLRNQLVARAGDKIEQLEPHLRPGREVAIGRGGLTEADQRELIARTALPRKGTADQRAQRMMPQLSMEGYNRAAQMRGEDPAMRAVAQHVSQARQYNQMIPQAISPKLGMLIKKALWLNAFRVAPASRTLRAA